MSDKLILLTVQEAAMLLRVPPRRLNDWRWSGQGPPWIKIGGRVRYKLCDLEGFVASRRQQPHLQQQIAV